MIDALYLCKASGTDPYQNQALEEYLTFHTRPGECILYLWQNSRTVVIGRNQNAWAECNAERLEADGGHVARRLSGGGAVYHDSGNLNFTFCVGRADFDVARQMEVILRAVQMQGVRAEKTGRNDIAAEGRKFSGNAFFESGEHAYHHGTLMLDVDAAALERYLNVSGAKLAAKGVASVRARVVNLVQLAPQLTVQAMERSLAAAAGEVYGLPVQELPAGRLDAQELGALRCKFASWEWIYGQKLPFTHRLEGRWPWGGVELVLEVRSGAVEQARLYSDALQADWFEGAGEALRGCPYRSELLSERLDAALMRRGADSAVRAALSAWLTAQLSGAQQTEASDGNTTV